MAIADELTYKPLIPPSAAKLILSTILIHRMTGMILNTQDLVNSQVSFQLTCMATVKARLLPLSSGFAVKLQNATDLLTGSDFLIDIYCQDTPNEKV